MTARRQFLLVVFLTLALVSLIKMAQLALTPEAWEALAYGGQRIADNLVVRLLLAGVAAIWLLSLSVAAWERSEQRYARETQERADRLARELAPETSSLMDDSPRGPLPESWKAPCGELVRFPDNPSDRGPKAA